MQDDEIVGVDNSASLLHEVVFTTLLLIGLLAAALYFGSHILGYFFGV